jgi:uncharacterized membrane protein YedE/YeeE
MGDVVIWAGWTGGFAIGVYAVIQYWFTSKPLGCSLSYGNFCAMTSRLPYFSRGAFESFVNWRLWFLLGIPLGGLGAAMTTPGYEWTLTTSMGGLYDQVMPQSLWLKALVVTVGGVLMGLGARFAGGCTSGHAIAGISFLNLPSMLAAALFFAGGIAVVQLMFRLLV